jgi:hypothetical protein
MGGRVGMLLQGSIDCFEDASQVPVDVIIPESKNTKTVISELIVPLSITFGFNIKVVLATIDLDDKPMFHADKINDKSLAR